jgi:hypothetical protein
MRLGGGCRGRRQLFVSSSCSLQYLTSTVLDGMHLHDQHSCVGLVTGASRWEILCWTVQPGIRGILRPSAQLLMWQHEACEE